MHLVESGFVSVPSCMLSCARRSFCRPLVDHVRFTSSSSASRRGRNLTERYRTRTKSERAEASTASVSEFQPAGLTRARTSTTPNTIAGFVIPREPRTPTDDECCMSGCAVCVYDLYEEELAVYKESANALRAALTERYIPESEWPAHIRTGQATHMLTTGEKSKGAVLDAFEEMQRALKEQRDKRAAVEAEKRARGDVLAGDGERVGLDLRGVYEAFRWVIYPNR